MTPVDCKAWQKLGIKKNGVYPIKPDNGPTFQVQIFYILIHLFFFLTCMQVYCDMETDGGGWTVFQRRQDGSVDFYKYWVDYEYGFGNLTEEFWLGLSKINYLTKKGSHSLRVDLGDFSNNKAYAQYSSFIIGNSASKYTLTVGGYSGTAGNSLAYHSGKKFSTRDNDNDKLTDRCPRERKGAWWFEHCNFSHLNGLYYHNPKDASGENGINWRGWKGNGYSLKFSEMKTRRNN